MSYVNNVTGNVEVTNAIGSIESITTTGNVTTVTAKAQVKATKVAGKLGIAHIMEKLMTPIELSTDINNPTEIMNLINKSGTYVAKNIGLLGSNGQVMAVFAKGQFFSISNLQEYGKAFGLEVPDSENVIDVDGRLIDGEHVTYRIIGGTQLKEIIWLNSENVKDYVKVDFNPADFININYGIQFYNGKLAIYSATLTDIENGVNNYKPITSNNIAYAVQTKGNNYFAKKTDFTDLQDKVESVEEDISTLETDISTLKSEIETILESVVTVDE